MDDVDAAVKTHKAKERVAFLLCDPLAAIIAESCMTAPGIASAVSSAVFVIAKIDLCSVSSFSFCSLSLATLQTSTPGVVSDKTMRISWAMAFNGFSLFWTTAKSERKPKLTMMLTRVAFA